MNLPASLPLASSLAAAALLFRTPISTWNSTSTSFSSSSSSSPLPRFFLSLALSSFPDPLFPVFLPLSLSVSTPRPLLVPRRRARRSWNFVVKMIEREDGFREGGWGKEPAARVGRTCERGRTTTGDDSSRGDWLLRCAFRSMNGMERVGGM